MSETYKKDGVDVKEGDSFSALAGKVCQASYKNSPFVLVHDLSSGHFRGPRSFSFQNLPDGYTLDAAPDGIGTKVILIDAAMSHLEAPRDLVAMCCGDITRFGGMPLVFINVLDVRSLGETDSGTNEALRKMILGLGKIAKEQGLVVFKGETAELGVCVGSENPGALTQFNWTGTAIGVYHPDKMITGASLAPGQAVIALKEKGFRSNGISSVRKALGMKFGNGWFCNPEAEKAIQMAATPSVLYDRFLVELNGWLHPKFIPQLKLHLIVHITGGAIRSKFAEDILFPRGLSANLDNLWDPPQIMRDCAEWRGMKDEEIYETWNGGQGALAVIDENMVQDFIEAALANGIQAKLCGYITQESSPQVVIQSKFSDRKIIYR